MKPNLIVKELTMSDHAFLRAQQRFDHKNKSDSLNYFKSILGVSNGAKYIGEDVCEKGSSSHLYIHKHAAIHLSMDLKVIKTVIKLDPIICHHSVRDKFLNIHKIELTKCERKEKKVLRALEEQKLSSDIELANLRFRLHKTRSKSVKVLCETKIQEINEYLKQFESQIEEIRNDKVKIMRAIAFI